MKTLKEKIEVMQAALDGKKIESRNYPYEDKYDWNDNFYSGIKWNWPHVDYRIKQEPMEFWANVFENDNPGFITKEKAKMHGENFSSYIKTIKVREVLDD